MMLVIDLIVYVCPFMVDAVGVFFSHPSLVPSLWVLSYSLPCSLP